MCLWSSFNDFDHYLCHHMLFLLLLLFLLIPLLSLYYSSWNNTVPKDLFDAMEQQRIDDNISVPLVQDFFEPWTTQPGYPVINVTRTNEIITVTQVRRFFRITKVNPLNWDCWFSIQNMTLVFNIAKFNMAYASSLQLVAEEKFPKIMTFSS